MSAAINGKPAARTLLYLIADSSARVMAWTAVLEEEGYEVQTIDKSAAQDRDAVKPIADRDYALLTIGLQDAKPLASLFDVGQHYPKAAIHYAPQSMTACSQDVIPGTECSFLYHLAEDQKELLAVLETLADSRYVSMPDSSASDDKAEAPLPSDCPTISVSVYPKVKEAEAAIWATALPFSIHTSKHAFFETTSEWARSAAGLSYTRNIALIKKNLGPEYELEKLWERHTRYEFETRDAGKTMETMIPQPYVNHVACMTGGSGYDELHRFYTNNFVTRSPPDTEMVPISRTIGADRIVDEMVFRCTHTCEIEYFLPGVAPTGRRIEIFMVAIVNFRGPKLAFESIYWDQASVLVQIGLLDPKNLPCAGVEIGRKVLDPYNQPSNTLFGSEARERARGALK